MAPQFCAPRTTSGRSQPEMCIAAVYLRSARAKEPPMRPVPRMVTREMRWGVIESFFSCQLLVLSPRNKSDDKCYRRDAEHAKGNGEFWDLSEEKSAASIGSAIAERHRRTLFPELSTDH